jgi:hypothetical protein
MRRGETLKLFWRAKKDVGTGGPQTAADSAETTTPSAAAKDAATEASPQPEPASAASEPEAAATPPSDSEAEATPSNVVTLQPAKLSERIAAAAMKTVATFTQQEELPHEVIAPRARGPLPGQEDAYKILQRALESDRARANILITGVPGSGRHAAARLAIEQRRATVPRPHDWLYVGGAGDGIRLKPFALPHGQGALFGREIRAAMARAGANHERLTAGDEYRLGLEIIDEEFRHRTGKTLDHLKRRAEGQNIALVKTPEGFVLAPMHEGKVVRSDVFRALPESLQRDVEAKIAGLEGELKMFIDQLPGEDAAHADRIAAFNLEAASRAIHPHFEPVRQAFNDARDLLDALEAGLVSATAANTRAGDGARAAQAVNVHVFAAQTAEDFSEPAPLVFAHDVSARGLLGEFGIDGAGRLSLTPGHLLLANGGFLVIEAWRLAASPEAWAALSAALERSELKPRCADSLAAEIEPVPLAVRLVLIADPVSMQHLGAIDPGFLRFFPYTVRMPGRVARAEMTAADYGAIAAALAEENGLRPVASPAAEVLYRAALAHGGNNGHVPLDMTALAGLLFEADLEAGAAQSGLIRAIDVETAVRRAGDFAAFNE